MSRRRQSDPYVLEGLGCFVTLLVTTDWILPDKCQERAAKAHSVGTDRCTDNVSSGRSCAPERAWAPLGSLRKNGAHVVQPDACTYNAAYYRSWQTDCFRGL